MTSKNTTFTAKIDTKNNEILATPIIDRWDILPANPSDGQFGFYNPTNNFKTWIAGIGWGTTAVTFLPSDNNKK